MNCAEISGGEVGGGFGWHLQVWHTQSGVFPGPYAFCSPRVPISAPIDTPDIRFFTHQALLHRSPLGGRGSKSAHRAGKVTDPQVGVVPVGTTVRPVPTMEPVFDAGQSSYPRMDIAVNGTELPLVVVIPKVVTQPSGTRLRSWKIMPSSQLSIAARRVTC
ncbi:MAG: hypothetical protein EPN30_01505 [Actinomycetota bacterium]|nr:MAG: hypothetical protein EPN30_01505 [Actinomycetota bacterium]